MSSRLPSEHHSEPLDEELSVVKHRQLIRSILANIAEGVSVADAKGNFIYLSPHAERLIGIGPGTSRPSQWTRAGFFLPDEQTPIPPEQLPIWRALSGEEVRDADMFVRNENVPQGRHIRCDCIPLRDEQDQVIGATTLVKDMGQTRQSEAERRRTEQRFQLLVETAREGIWTIDEESRTTYANRFLADLLGYSVEEMMGRPLFAFMDEEGRRQAEQKVEQRRQGVAEVHDFKLQRKDGSYVWTSISTAPMYDGQGRYTGALAMVTDITARRDAEEQVRKLNAELERRIAERTAQLEFSNRELEAFAYSVAHDLRAPLRAITSFSDALTEDCADRLDDLGRDYVKRIRGSAQRMTELINGILALSRVNRTALVPSRCDLSAMARAIAEQFQAQAPGRTVRFTVQDGLVDQGDPNLLRSVLENLLDNAWKFTRNQGVAEIEFGMSQEPGGRTYFVRDNGAGFEMEYRDKLFGVFQRLHSQAEFEGNGVGLATVQRAIRRHGGRIWGEGAPGKGACFYFTLNELSHPPATAAIPPGVPS